MSEAPQRPASVRPFVTASGESQAIDTAVTLSNVAVSSDSDLRHVFPIAPYEMIRRYERNVVIQPTKSHYTVPRLTKKLERGGEPPGWTALCHPEGTLYWYQEEKKILTDAYLYEGEALNDIEAFIKQIEHTLLKSSISRGPNTELVLERYPERDKVAACGYYFVNHDHRCIFWYEEFDISEMLREVKGAQCPNHIKFMMEAEYWKHWELFPNVQTPTVAILQELKEIILYSAIDDATSSFSTSPHPMDDLSKMLTIVNNITVPPIKDRMGYSACVIGRLMYMCFRCKFLNFHGQPGVRLNRDQAIYGSRDHSSLLLMVILSPLLFYAPHTHAQSLEKVYVDSLVTFAPWHDFVGKLSEEWKEVTLYGTVILNANVAFLAIQSIDNDRNAWTRSPAQIASYLSLVTSVGSVILGLSLTRQYRSRKCEAPCDAAAFLKRMDHPTWGLTVLAIIYSLPYGLLMWGPNTEYSAFWPLFHLCAWNTLTLPHAAVQVAWEQESYLWNYIRSLWQHLRIWAAHVTHFTKRSWDWLLHSSWRLSVNMNAIVRGDSGLV